MFGGSLDYEFLLHEMQNTVYYNWSDSHVCLLIQLYSITTTNCLQRNQSLVYG